MANLFSFTSYSLSDLVLLYKLKVLHKEPVMIYQMGKVGSKSIYAALNNCGIDLLFHVHRLNPANIEKVKVDAKSRGLILDEEVEGKRLFRFVAQSHQKVRIITLVREPVRRNVSAFFQNLNQYVKENHSASELVRIFFSEYPQNIPLEWFDIELKTVFGMDVFKYPFDKDAGVAVLQKDDIRLILLKAEISDDQKSKALADFLGIEDVKIHRQNVSYQKSYGAVYAEFLNSISYQEDYLDRMYTSKYATHFYSEEEIKHFRAGLKTIGNNA